MKKPIAAKHNHITRDIKPMGECLACDNYHLKRKADKLAELLCEIDEYLNQSGSKNKMKQLVYYCIPDNEIYIIERRDLFYNLAYYSAKNTWLFLGEL